MKAMRVMESPNMETEAPSQKRRKFGLAKTSRYPANITASARFQIEAPARSAFDRAIAAGFEHLRHAGPGEDGGKGGARAMQGGQALDLAGAGAKGLGRRRPEQRGCQAVPAPNRLDEKADNAPGRRRLLCAMEDTGGGQAGEIAA